MRFGCALRLGHLFAGGVVRDQFPGVVNPEALGDEVEDFDADELLPPAFDVGEGLVLDPGVRGELPELHAQLLPHAADLGVLDYWHG